ncbi:MAG TPA: FtsX-like permease family protein, partial [Bacteroidales bacterium]|nr:FtsX-like permease family protein [Bacteroidales bacterium]
LREFLVPVSISLLIALPAGWIVVKNLLKQFASRINIDIHVFLLIAVATLLIAMVTVIYQAYKATRINPAESLKIE